MCSVVGCGSGRRSAQRFKLPEDPERRLEWVQFIFEVNGQQLKESSWTDITICNEHFTDDCFEYLSPAPGVTWVQLKPDAVPSLHFKAEPDEPLDEPLESPQHVEPPISPDAPVAVTCKSDQMQPNVLNLNMEKSALLQTKGKCVVYESCLLQLFRHTCPSCGFKLQMEKVTYGLLIVLNQLCLQCDYRNQWKSQVNASVPTAEDQDLAEDWGDRTRTSMCSVVGCGSGRRSAQRFKLPEDPERRLEWVQFIFEVNGQQLKESSWTDITICNEHFTEDCFEYLSPAPGVTWVQLKPDAVPSLHFKAEPDEPLDEPLESPQHVDPPVSPDAPVAVTCRSDQTQPNELNLNEEKSALLQTKGKCVVYESCLLQLFRRTCPSCGFKLQVEKVTYGMLIVLNQLCLRCDYKNQWKSQVNASVPKAEERDLTEETPTDDNPSSAVLSEIISFSDEDSDPSDEGEEGEKGDKVKASSDRDWIPTEEILLPEEVTKDSEEDSEDDDEGDEEEEEDSDTPGGLKINELCTECGSFFNIQKRHVCEHKVKPYSCNICGKRCVTETSLKAHSHIHDETYEHPCKYCFVTFKTRVDKLKHEQIHKDSKDPYKCPDCPSTFTTRKKRNIHLKTHRGPPEYNCGVCGIAFKDVHHLRRHSVVHTGLKPYTCSVCQRGFNQGSHLKSHMRLHTGERPFKCEHCDKRFNHNVSLKSHVQRYHSSSSGCAQEKVKIDEREKDLGDAEDSGNKKGTDSEFENVEEEQEEQDTKEDEGTNVPKKNRMRCTGRPRGRPKRNAAGHFVSAGEKQSRQSNAAKTAKSKARKFKKTGSSDEESEEEQSDSDFFFDSAEEEEETETVTKSAGRSRGKTRNDRDSDFDPDEEIKKTKYSSQSSGKSSGKRRGRPKKNQEV